MDIRVFSGLEAVVDYAVGAFIQLAEEAIRQRDIFTVALSGGSTPKRLYSALADSEFQEVLDWERTHLFWGDERAVPPNHQDSNYRMVSEALLR